MLTIKDIAQRYSQKRGGKITEKQAEDLLRCAFQFMRQDKKQYTAFEIPQIGLMYKKSNNAFNVSQEQEDLMFELFYTAGGNKPFEESFIKKIYGHNIDRDDLQHIQNNHTFEN